MVLLLPVRVNLMKMLLPVQHDPRLGLETDVRFVVSNWKVALSVGLAGMILPFALGAAIAWGLYNEFRDEPDIVHIQFGVYMLFVGIAMAITVRWC